MDIDLIEQIYEKFKLHPAICTDTRHIEQGALFFALKGGNFDGNQFAAQALAQGCAYAIVDDPNVIPNPSNTPVVIAPTNTPNSDTNHDNTPSTPSTTTPTHTINTPNTNHDTRTLNSNPPNSNSNHFTSAYILVNDVLTALQALANHHRQTLNTPIIALTGSNGKTTTKELIYSVLSTQYNTLATQGNLNNHIGVPLTLLKLRPDHQIGIIEMGANHQGEIAQLCQIAQPDIGLITNIGKAHLEGFGGPEGVIKGKSEMYRYIASKPGKQLIVNIDNPILTKLVSEIFPASTLGSDPTPSLDSVPPSSLSSVQNSAFTSSPTSFLTYGTNSSASIQGKFISAEPNLSFEWLNPPHNPSTLQQPTSLNHSIKQSIHQADHQSAQNQNQFQDQQSNHQSAQLQNQNKSQTQSQSQSQYIQTQLAGSYNFENALAAIAIGQYFNIDPKDIVAGIQAYLPNNSRSQWMKTDNNRILLDAYNANPTSMQAAIQNFSQLPDLNKCLILGDMFELGDESDKEHQQIIEQIISHSKSFHSVLLVGPNFCKALQTLQDLPNKPYISNILNLPNKLDFNDRQSIHSTQSIFYSFITTAEANKFLLSKKEEVPTINHSADPSPLNQNRTFPKQACILIKGSRGMKLETLLNVL